MPKESYSDLLLSQQRTPKNALSPLEFLRKAENHNKTKNTLHQAENERIFRLILLKTPDKDLSRDMKGLITNLT